MTWSAIYGKTPVMTARQSLGSDVGSFLMGSVRLCGFLVMVIALVPVHIAYSLCKPENASRMPQFFHRLLIRILGFHVRVHGVMASTPPVLFVANHSSYLDIPVLGAIIPAAFVAKSEVRHWPLFGHLARLQHTVFVERRSSRTGAHRDEMRARLDGGQNLILFAEGTSSDGMRVLPFKSSLFGALENKASPSPASIQPVSIVCTEIDGLPITRAWRPYYAWFGDMTLLGHLWNVFKLGRFTVDVVFHPPLSPAAFPDRKALAAHCQQQVAHGIELCLTGRHTRPEHAAKLAAPKPDLASLPQA
jgi:lyso-ornithine lipid O-acyltransferase